MDICESEIWKKFLIFKDEHNRLALKNGGELIGNVTPSALFSDCPLPTISDEEAFKIYADSLHQAENEIRSELLRDAASASSFRGGGRNKKGKIYEPKLSIKTICQKIGSFDFNAVIAAISDLDQCADWYESTSAPINTLFEEVDTEDKVIHYRRRGDKSSKTKQLSFGALKNHLRSLTKS